MKKRLLSIFMVIIIIGVLISTVTIFLISPGINKINLSNNMVKLSEEEKQNKEQELIKEYADKEKELDTKYVNLQQELNNKYDSLKQEVREKYNKLISDLDSKYTTPMNKEGWYSEQTKKMQESSEYRSKMGEEIGSLNSLEFSEKNNLESQKRTEQSTLKSEKDSKIEFIRKDNNEKEKTYAKGIIYLLTGSIILIFLVGYIIIMFNSLIKLRNSVKEKLAQIDVLLKRRIDLIPNIVETVKSYSNHESTTLENIIKARNTILNSKNEKDKYKENEKFDKDVTSLLAVIENYPEMKANANFMSLQRDLSETEDLIANSRQNYNTAVLKYKNKIEIFPSNLIANICNFKSDDFYSMLASEKDNVKIKL